MDGFIVDLDPQILHTFTLTKWTPTSPGPFILVLLRQISVYPEVLRTEYPLRPFLSWGTSVEFHGEKVMVITSLESWTS